MSSRLFCALVVLTFLFSGKARAGMDRQPEKIGKCPEPGIGICVELCSCDFDCDGKQKCCSNGCGHVCLNPVVSVKDMRKINKQACPKPFGNGTCDQLCEKHKDCECDQKCCFNGCGNECMDVTWDYDCDYTYKCGGKIGKECPPGFMCKLPFEGVDVRGVCCKDRPQMPDCSKVICPKPNCPNAYTPEGKCCPECPVCDFPCPEPACSNPVFPPGECCPKCEPDCSAVVCPLPKCQNPFTPEGECCPICPDCSNVVCPMLKCQNSYVPPGECCAVCVPDCSAVQCMEPDCQNSYTPEGQCCPICPDCRLVICPAIFCEDFFYPPGECCPKCVPDCSEVVCNPVSCHNPFTPKHECCPICPDCSNVACPLIYCEDPVFPPGACCPLCPPDCSKVLCPKPPCSNSYIPDGECCAVCPDCSLVLCQPIFCEIQYIPKGECCAQCIPGCCTYKNRKYKAGERFQDDCNVCTCHDDGSVSCTKRNCVTCTYKGKTYKAGESFPDDCNTCTCNEDGNVACTLKYCVPCQYKKFTYESGTKFAVKCNTCTCSSGSVGCTEKACIGLCANGQKPLPKAICGGKKDLKCRKKGYQCDFSNVVGEVEDPLGICCKVQKCPNGLKALSYTYCDDDLVCPNGYTCEDSNDKKGPSKICCLDCTNVTCPKPPCRGCYTTDCQCCPICPGYCLYKGKYYKAGKTFDDDCNTCTCSKKGLVACTDAYCPPCKYEGVVYESGTSFNVKCNQCKCSSGKVSCTKKSCDGLCANGLKPLPDEVCGGIAGLPCKTEGYECDYSNVPKGGADFFGICCKALVCPNGLKPLSYTLCSKGMVCPNKYTCEAPAEGIKPNGICCLDCSNVKCAKPECNNSYVPEGQCCPICPGGCIVDGVVYQPGESYFADCNRCTCGKGGLSICTLIACGPACYREGRPYKDGENVPTDNPCESCTCFFDNTTGEYEIVCAQIGCPPPPCEFPRFKKDVCCPICDGSCTVDGVTYEDGEHFYRECNKCYCNNGLPVCTLMGCEPGCYKEGIRYIDGETVPSGDPCVDCTCHEVEEDKFEILCSSVGCPPIPCKFPRYIKDVCCPVCDGTCTVDGVIYQDGESFFKECNKCTCTNGVPICTLKGCLPGCYKDGERYDNGDIIETDDPCEHCECLLQDGEYRIDCAIQDCPKPICDNPRFPEGECCGICDEPCVEDGIIYQSGQSFFRECNRCKCINGMAGCTKLSCRPGCYRNGTRYDKGDEVPGNNPCEKDCKCYLEGSKYKIGCDVDLCEESCAEDGIIYPSGESFYRKCNRCVCRNGLAKCTRKACPPGCYRDGIRHEEGEDVSTNNPCEKNCKCYLEDEEYKIGCDADSCEKPCIEDGIIYPSGVTFYRDCNSCKCKNGLAGCTKKLCAPGCYRNGTRYEKGEGVPSNNPCERNCKCYLEGNKYKIGCDINSCEDSCLENGIVYQSGETFFRECNRCTCRNGLAACTKKGCFPGCYRNGIRYDEGDDVKSNSPCEKKCKCYLEDREYKIGCHVDSCEESCVEDGIIYPSGETFYQECNTCTCGNGLAGCTKIGCLPGCYRNGSRYDKGDEVPGHDPCEKCTCYLENREYKIKCDISSCKKPCVEDGIIYQSGETFYRECNRCKCNNGLAGCTRIACADGCYRNGTRYDEGDEVERNNECEKNCKCYLKDDKYEIGCEVNECEEPCIEDGIIYQSGETFYRECNKCTCKNGQAGCTKIGCPPGCYRNGTHYEEGDIVPSNYPCEKKCRCFLEGEKYKIGCDIEGCKKPCVEDGIIYQSGETFYRECNRCQCENGKAGCTRIACAAGCYRNGTRYEKGEDVESNNQCEKRCECFLEGNDYRIGCDIDQCGEPCVEDGLIYQSGESFYRECNICRCGNGLAGCTKIYCAPGCYRNRTRYDQGDGVPSNNPCEKRCKCYLEGKQYKIGCDMEDCQAPCIVNGTSYPSGTSFWDQCNSCFCANGTAGCTLMLCVPGCYKDGERYENGDIIETDDPCEHCECLLQDGEYRIDCAIQGCPKPICDNPRFPEGECCGICDGCFENGVYYEFGEKVPDRALCEINCICAENGFVACAIVDCPPFCENPQYVEGQCCPICVPDGNGPGQNQSLVEQNGCYEPLRYCFYKGEVYEPGEKFPDDCNTCFCAEDGSGSVGCTEMFCVPCTYEGVVYDSGTSFRVQCNTCTCSSGNIKCTEMSCGQYCGNGLKPLPNDTCGGIAGLECKTEGYECDFSNVPDGGADFFGLCCKVEVCPSGLKPLKYTHCDKNLVCPQTFTCEPSEGAKNLYGICCKDCSTVKCGRPVCEDPFIPDGECCPICPKPCVEDGIIYQSGQPFFRECNRCKCINGMAGCTKLYCLPGCYRNGTRYDKGDEVPGNNPCEKDCKCYLEGSKYKIGCDVDLCEESCAEDGIIIPSGERFYRKCNRCVCRNGLAKCTRKACPPGCYRDGIRHEEGEDVTTNNPCEKNCKCYLEGEEYKIGCDADSCEKPCIEDGIIYPSGETFYRECNTCKCKNGLAGCSKKACAPGCYRNGKHYEKGVGVPSNNPCERNCKCYLEGSKYKVGCDINSCEEPCLENGIVYQSGETFFRECNRCTCRNGLAACTKIGCFPGCYRNGILYDEGDDVKSNSPCEKKCKCYLEDREYKIGCHVDSCEQSCVEDGIIYPSGETFYQECNTCTCGNGLAGCTRIGCLPGCYRNGSRYDKGDEVPGHDPCEKCTCYLEDREYKIKCDISSCKKPCVEDGIIYQSGETFYRECNRCKCNNGLAGCTRIACADGCYRNGTRYDEGDEVERNNECEKNCKCYLKDDKYEIGCEVKECEEPCVEDGIIYQSGETFYRECNKCTCKDGLAGCTKIGCPPGCYRNGTPYEEGDIVPSNYPCEKKCRCFLEGDKYKIGCDIEGCKKPCVEGGIIYQSGESFYRECNRCQCENGKAGCTRIACAAGCYRNGTHYEKGEDVESNNQCEKRCECFLEGNDYRIGCDIDQCGEPCVEDGLIYQSGESFYRECNICRCRNGLAGCTKIYCAPGCYRNRIRYDQGDGVPSNNPCEKRCKCFLEGKEYEIGCDMEDCQAPCIVNGTSYPSGTSFWDQCNACFCANGAAGCTLMLCAPGCYRNGKRYDKGDDVPSDDPCEKNCKCYLENREYVIKCDIEKCPAIICKNPRYVEGECCPKCDLPCFVNGTLYPQGSTFWDKCNKCSCSNGLASCTDAFCPPGCYKDGKRYELGDQVPGDNPCEVCYCTGRYEIFCAIIDCVFPLPCTKPVYMENECCPICPPGCVDSDGKFYKINDEIPTGSPCEFCFCAAPNSIECNIIDCAAPPCPNPIIKPDECCPVCELVCYDENGNGYFPGQEIPDNDPCKSCFCQEDGRILCSAIGCALPFPCEDIFTPPGECCPVCREGCSKDGVLYKEGDEVPDPDPCKTCRCTENHVICISRICPPLPCDNTVHREGECCPVCLQDGCTDDASGVYYPIGQIVLRIDPCSRCFCNRSCIIDCHIKVECAQPRCDNPVTLPGNCCPYCDTGSCEYKGHTFKAGEKLEIGCCTCECRFGEAQCSCIHCPPCPTDPDDPPLPPALKCCGCT